MLESNKWIVEGEQAENTKAFMAKVVAFEAKRKALSEELAALEQESWELRQYWFEANDYSHIDTCYFSNNNPEDDLARWASSNHNC